MFVFDLDGTLADQSHRYPNIENNPTPEDWDMYFSLCHLDTVIEPVATLFRQLRANHRIEIWTARNEVSREATIDWLNRNDLKPDGIRMRPAKDRSSDDILKSKWLKQHRSLGNAPILGVFEDRDRVVKMWRFHGIQCYQVNEGNF